MIKNNKKVIICLCVLSIIVFILGMHGGSAYYFRDFCLHKTLNMFYNSGSPEFFKKPNLVSDIQFVVYGLYYLILKGLHIVNHFSEFVNYFSQNYIPTANGKLSYMTPALIINNIFAVIGVCYTFLITYIITDKKIFPSFVSAFILATSFIWMNFSHHLTVDIPLSALCVVTVFYTIYFIKDKDNFTQKEIFILGLLSGLCASAKYNGIIVIVAPLAVLMLTEKSKKDFIYKIINLFSSATYIFILTNPFILIKFNHFWFDLTYEYDHAFNIGHAGSDDCNPLRFHLFHSFFNAMGILPFILSLIGSVMFWKDDNVPKKFKYSLLYFPILFFLSMSFSLLVFLRYILPVIPFIAVMVGMFVYYVLQKNNKFIKVLFCSVILIMLVQNSCNAVHFYKIMSYKDTRVLIKQAFKDLNFIKNNEILYTDIFSNPYYEDDFVQKNGYIKNNLKEYLFKANNNSIEITPIRNEFLYSNYQIIIFDNYTFDKPIQIRKDDKYRGIKWQYNIYLPYRSGKFQIERINEDFYVVQVNPFKVDKSKVPFDILRSDFKYREKQGPFVEIYFKDKKLRDIFAENCTKYQLKCSITDKEHGYYYTNLKKSDIMEDFIFLETKDNYK